MIEKEYIEDNPSDEEYDWNKLDDIMLRTRDLQQQFFLFDPVTGIRRHNSLLNRRIVHPFEMDEFFLFFEEHEEDDFYD